MRWRLRSYEQTPPGGYCFEEPGFKRVCLPVIEDVARRVEAFRKGNGRARATIQEALRDVDTYQCQRLGNNQTFCIPCEKGSQAVALNQTAPIIAPPCQGCGVVVQ